MNCWTLPGDDSPAYDVQRSYRIGANDTRQFIQTKCAQCLIGVLFCTRDRLDILVPRSAVSEECPVLRANTGVVVKKPRGDNQ